MLDMPISLSVECLMRCWNSAEPSLSSIAAGAPDIRVSMVPKMDIDLLRITRLLLVSSWGALSEVKASQNSPSSTTSLLFGT